MAEIAGETARTSCKARPDRADSRRDREAGAERSSLHRQYRGVYSVGHAHLSREGRLARGRVRSGRRSRTRLSQCCLSLQDDPRTSRTRSTSSRPKHGGRSPDSSSTRCRNLDPRDIVIVNAIPVTTVARTLVDLTDVMTAEQLANVIHEAAFREIFSEPATRAAMARAPGRRLSDPRGGAAPPQLRQRRQQEQERGSLPQARPRRRPPRPAQERRRSTASRSTSAGPTCASRSTARATGASGPRPTTASATRRCTARGITILRFTEDDLTLRPHAVLAELAAQQLARAVARQ